MSSVKTKNAIDDPSPKSESSDDDSIIESSKIINNSSDNVVNVEFLDCSKDNVIIRLDMMHIENDEGRYYSITYNLSTTYGTNGLFDFLEDYYSRKFGVFLSSKKVQALLVALHKLENGFNKNRCYSFKNYCEVITENSIERVSKDSKFSNVMGIRIVDGYSLGEEAATIYHLKHCGIEIGNHIEKYGKQLKKEFDDIISKMDKTKFCCVCVSRNDKLPPSFLIDPLIGLPLIVYDETFAKELMRNNFKSFIESELFDIAEITDIYVDLWGVAPDVTVKSLMGIVGEDGELNMEYTDKSMDETDLFLGKFKTLRFNKNTYKNSKFSGTVIGY